MTSQTVRAHRQTAAAWLAAEQPALIVEVVAIKGSTPREAGVRMLVGLSEVHGTIGGGHLEWQAIEQARQALRETQGLNLAAWTADLALGPTLGQCCGGALTLRFAPLNAAELEAWMVPPARFHLDLHGAGHVGQAIIRLLADLDCTVRWIDERGDDSGPDAPGLPSEAMLASLPPHITWLPTDAAEHEVPDAPPGACHLVLTHRHDLDLRIISAVLKKGDFHYAGMIGSKTKKAKFLHRLSEQGLSADTLARMTCPIGIPGIEGKEPAVIAMAVVGQLLQVCPPITSIHGHD